MTIKHGLIKELKKYYKNRISSVQVRIGQSPSGGEVTFRSRSIIFIGLGIYTASLAGKNIDMIIPENGNIALNVQLTPSRRGSCSTRTAHPFLLTSIDQVLDNIGFENRITNFLGLKTKGVACFKSSVDTKTIFRTFFSFKEENNVGEICRPYSISSKYGSE